MDKKVVFLDIDGTIVDFFGNIPESTKTAIRKARENGHYMVVCSGRSKFQIAKEVLDLGIDGIVAAAGAYVEYEGKVVYHKCMTKEQREKLGRYLKDNNFIFSIQTDTRIITTEKCKEKLTEGFVKAGASKKHIENTFGKMEIREDVWTPDNQEKAVYQTGPFPGDKVAADLAPDFENTPLSYNNQKNGGEITIAGVNKAIGMREFLKAAQVSVVNSVAVGDGPNDFEMIEFAGTGIAMGNAIPDLKDKADMVTTDINNDGIYNAFEKLGLL